jgi:ribose/xylose/arabinose/galactoside ABC-type transport system permease subunit
MKSSRELDLLTVIYLALIVACILYPRSFFSLDMAEAILRNMAIDGILAIGMMILMVAGVFDLSVGAVMSLAGVVTGSLLVGGASVPVAILGGLLTGFVCGALNGLIVTQFQVNPLITTLATMGIFRGVALLRGGVSIPNLPPEFTVLGQSEWPKLQLGGAELKLQSPVWLMLGLAVVAHLLMSRTRWFRQLYYIGANPKAATLSGIPAAKVQWIAFILSGVIAAIAGIAFAARMGTAVSTAGDGAELRVITAVILGGASLQGGRGTILGAIVGVVFMSLVYNLLLVVRVDSYWQGIVFGAILIAAVGLDSWKNRGRSR